jgi:hypothetical protein
MIMGFRFMRRMIVVVMTVIAGMVMIMQISCHAVRMFMFVFMEMFMRVRMRMLVRMLHPPVTVFMHMSVIMLMCVQMLVFMRSVHFKISFRREFQPFMGILLKGIIIPDTRLCQGFSA